MTIAQVLFDFEPCLQPPRQSQSTIGCCHWVKVINHNKRTEDILSEYFFQRNMSDLSRISPVEYPMIPIAAQVITAINPKRDDARRIFLSNM